MTIPNSCLPSAPVEAFKGPLDLLLDEVRRQNIAIEDVALAPLVARYLEYMRMAASRSLNLDIEWVHIASTLIHWKSRSLLPAGMGFRQKVDPIRNELVQQLLAHRKHAAEDLASRRSAEGTHFSRQAVQQFGEETVREEPVDSSFVSVWDLMQQARELARWSQEYRANRHEVPVLCVTQDGVTVLKMMEYLSNQLNENRERIVDGSKLMRSQTDPSRRCCLLLAMLEMARSHAVAIEQEQAFGQIRITKSP